VRARSSKKISQNNRSRFAAKVSETYKSGCRYEYRLFNNLHGTEPGHFPAFFLMTGPGKEGLKRGKAKGIQNFSPVFRVPVGGQPINPHCLGKPFMGGLAGDAGGAGD
jgi:hypothetical protein